MPRRQLNPEYKKMLRERARREELALQRQIKQLETKERSFAKYIEMVKEQLGSGSIWFLENELDRIRDKIRELQGIAEKSITPKPNNSRVPKTESPQEAPLWGSLIEQGNRSDMWYQYKYSKGLYYTLKEWGKVRAHRHERDRSALLKALEKELQKEYQLWGEEFSSKNEKGAWTDRKVQNYFNHLMKNKPWAILHIFINAETFDDAVKEIADIFRNKQIEGYLDPEYQKAMFDRVQGIQLLNLPFSKDIAEELYKISPEALYENKDDPKDIYKKVYRKHGKKYDSGYEEMFKELPKSRKRGVPEPRPLHIDDHADASWHELIINDIFKLCGIKFEFQIRYEKYIKKWIIDYIINGRWFEVFGRNEPEYAAEMKEKIRVIPRLLWIDVRKYSPGQNRILKKYAEKLDKEICEKEGCGLSLLGKSILSILYQNVELLKEEGIPLTTSYKTYLEQISSTDISRIRQKVDERVPELKLAQTQPISLQQITQELSQQYQSVQLWDDHEKIAVYFKTAQNLMAHMPQQNYQFQNYLPRQQTNQRMVAHNWYKRLKY